MTTQKKIAVATGSNRGLGYAISRKLSQNGIHVVLTSRNETDGLAAKQQLSSEGLDVNYHILDVTNDMSVAEFTQWLRETYGRIDILVNNAGINPTIKPEESSLLTVQLETMRSTLDTNVIALLRVSQALIPLMKVHNYGRIVNVSTEMASLAAMTSDFYPLAPSYRLSKLGVNGLTVLLGIVNQMQGQLRHLSNLHKKLLRHEKRLPTAELRLTHILDITNRAIALF